MSSRVKFLQYFTFPLHRPNLSDCAGCALYHAASSGVYHGVGPAQAEPANRTPF